MTQLTVSERLTAADASPAMSTLGTRPDASHLMPAGPTLDLAVVDTVAGLAALEADWNDLYARAATPNQIFQQFNWCWHWAAHYATGPDAPRRIAIVTGRSDGRLVLLLPLAVQTTATLRELQWLGEPVSQYGDVLVAPEASHPAHLLAAWSLVVKATRADVANLRKVRADAPAVLLMERTGAVVTATEDAPYLRLDGEQSFAGWEERRRPRALKNRRRQARRLADTGPVTVERMTATPEAGDAAEAAVALKRETLADRGEFAPALNDRRFAAFFRDACASSERPTGATVHTLSCDGKPVARKILLETTAASFLHVAVYDPAFERCAPGALLLENVIGDCIEKRRATLDLLPPLHAYKMDFADGVVTVSDYALAISTRGWLYMNGYLRLRRRLKAAITTLPPSVRRLVTRATT
jgi:CelD/BcsL family acetyltransferase involved in cellulose biosynthesis